jgi:hypothetical protein
MMMMLMMMMLMMMMRRMAEATPDAVIMHYFHRLWM